MSVSVDLSEKQLRLGILKLALSLAMLFAILAIGLTYLAGSGQSVAVSTLLVCFAFAMLTNGVPAALKIIDWFEARKQRNG